MNFRPYNYFKIIKKDFISFIKTKPKKKKKRRHGKNSKYVNDYWWITRCWDNGF